MATFLLEAYLTDQQLHFWVTASSFAGRVYYKWSTFYLVGATFQGCLTHKNKTSCEGIRSLVPQITPNHWKNWVNAFALCLSELFWGVRGGIGPKSAGELVLVSNPRISDMGNHLWSFSGTSDRSEGQEQGEGTVGGQGQLRGVKL